MSSSIKSSMLKHWRNSSISLGRSGSKREKSEKKAVKRQSTHAVVTPLSTIESPESPAEIMDTEVHEERIDDSAATTSEATPPSKGISLQVTVHIAPENVERFLVAFKAIFDVVAAEPECLFFEVYKSVEEPGKLSWIENWSKDIQWFLEHQITKPYYKEYLEFTEPMFLKPREARILEPLGPEFSMIKGGRLGH
ncbi:uncharacterized protein F4817DRAFT_279654 [Daldinia loculata]|uniref:uncharacterized protein n=1 Tax=Daldinia loculata TaxID=103429 RepID=UPI0020C320D0|nr:uncharacterized protein F4817DRAFT_279654 [Daldinia loculata]KAI1650126.1 hypothetical protein F4817DRAFT_279654 [Daldinia loculata]